MPDARSAALSPVSVLAVFVGGAAGTTLRAVVADLAPPVDAVPVATLGINVLGAVALGALLAALARRGGDTGRRRTLRLLLGTGVLGGFTTFSALAVDTVVLLEARRPVEALAYAVGSVLAGVLGAALGSRLGRRG
ncbi:MAG TPA: CrcB family protein [Amnibacterium sp.]|nr:CrcB family protein [Amnibacterium sp.]